eukprot:TRINITY_DN11114_c0_g1_i1.p1 TRINITY_DN11114_c0_g1~~TRINITY_DN11114_c0_g1_i1.p1  ORF type:complete len:1463 (+),score=442.57 TRINITY_DN11114_c0_g1_i1:286-4389(+)
MPALVKRTSNIKDLKKPSSLKAHTLKEKKATISESDRAPPTPPPRSDSHSPPFQRKVSITGVEPEQSPARESSMGSDVFRRPPVSPESLPSSVRRVAGPQTAERARQNSYESTAATVSGVVHRVNSTLSLGNGVGFYTSDHMVCHGTGDDEGTPCEVRISGSLFLVHHRSLEKADIGSHRQSLRPKIFIKLALVNIVAAEIDGLKGSLQLSVVPGDKDVVPTNAPTPSTHRATEKRGTIASRVSDSLAATHTYELVTEDDRVLEEMLHCLLHQQTKAYQAEIGKLRRSLKPKGTKTLDIVHFNDVYHLSVHKKEEPCGGLTRFYHAIEEIRTKKNPLVLFSGDFVGPSLMSVITKGKQMIDALNFIGTHYGVFGNHEFDFGLRNLERIVHGYTQGEYIFAGSTATWLMSNMDGKNGQPLGNVERRKLLEWNGVMIGILGLCENWLPHCPRLQKDDASYRDIFEIGESEAQALKEQGAQVVIALTHNRLAMDRTVTKRCPSIDLLLGGHDHFYKKDLDARVIKSGEEFQWLSEVQLHIHEAPEDGGKEPPPTINCRTHPISSDLPENEMVDKLVKRYGEKMRERMGKHIGCSAVALDSTEEACRFTEGALTNFLADLMQDETNSDCAVLGGAAVAGKVLQEPGMITIGDVFNWFPDEIKVQVVEMSGYWLQQLLSKSVVECPNEAPSFPHPSSNLTFTLSQIGVPSVSEVRVRGVPIDYERTYTCAVTDFVAAGKERFKFIKEHCKVLTDSEHAEQFSMWVLEYFRRRTMKAEESGLEATEREMVNPQQAKSQAKRRRRSSFGMEQETVHEDRFELMDDDLLDLGEETMRLLMKSLMTVSEETSPQQTQTSIKAAVKKLLDCDRTAIFLVDPVRQQLRFLPDGSAVEVRIPIAAGIAGNCATSGEVLNIPDAYQDPRFNQDVDRQTGYRTYNILASPVKRKDGSVVAVMQAVNKRGNEDFTTTDAKILNLFGKQTAITLGHAEVFDSLKKNQEATSTLLKVARDIASDVTMDMNTMIACIMSGSSQLLQSDRSSLFLVDSEAQEMWTIIIDPTTGAETIIRLPVGTGLAGHTAVTGQVLNLADAYDSALFNSEFDQKSGYRTKQVLCVPIFTSEESSDVLGVLQFINKIDGTDFSKQDEATAEAFASFAGISIANTQEIDLLKLKSDDKQYHEMPPPTMGRIKVKGGWSTVRKVLLEPVSRAALFAAIQSQEHALSSARISARTKQLMAEDASSMRRQVPSVRVKGPNSMRQRSSTAINKASSSPFSSSPHLRRLDESNLSPETCGFLISPTPSDHLPSQLVGHSARSMVRKVSLGNIPQTQSWIVGMKSEEVDSCTDSESSSPRHRIPERRGSRHSVLAPRRGSMAC